MKIAAYILFIATCCIVVMESCKKPAPATTGGGKGGNATLSITPEHHGQFVDTCTLYIKYATKDAPASGIYNDSAICVIVDTTPVATFTHLTNGTYYIFGVGYHATYVPPNVKGGLPVTISKQDTMIVYLPTYSYQP
jgi:hypothetical protein